MKEIDSKAGAVLENLRGSLERMKTLAAWQELKQSEAKPGDQPSFVMYDPTETDFRNEHSFFVANLAELRFMALEETAGKSTKRDTRIATELNRLEQQLHALRLSTHMDWRT